ncbi:hypothetical protein EW146_g6417 [Bondarzewia mesenterica]|uniref:DUF654-domain-containing protein n=1 Tax=Bondarzewia mesenterica TaxID=1095465 RepID=A0A4S4LNS0_9AGAM|nr:hypothetical protein EW146_g6417 [Bondarzewia mesenterica]
MPPRSSKRQQREQEELLALGGSVGLEQSSGEEDHQVPAKSGFAALNQLLPADDGDDDDERSGPQKTKAKKSKKKKKKSTASSTLIQAVRSPLTPASPSAASLSISTPVPGPSKQERKALKKQKAKERKDGKDEIDKALEELSIKYPDFQNVASKTSPAPDQSSQELNTLLSVSISHLDPDAEMRKFFGAKVISASKSASGSSSPNSRRQPASRSNLTRPQPTWWPAKMREGLSLRPLSDEECKYKAIRNAWSDISERWWTVEYSKRYKGVTMSFMRTVLSGGNYHRLTFVVPGSHSAISDPEGFYGIIKQVPWHADTLLQLAELYSHREGTPLQRFSSTISDIVSLPEHSQAADFIERAMFTYERAFVGAFNFTSGTNRLDFDHVENRPFFLAIHRQVIDLQRRGLFRTAFEFSRLLYALDPWTDPHGALFHLDFLAVKAGMNQWLLDLYNFFDSRVSGAGSSTSTFQGRIVVTALPGWAYARALALRSGTNSNESKQQESTEALKEAIIAFPSIVPLLADKADISLSSEVRGQGAFRIFTKGYLSSVQESLLHLLSHLYVQRSAPLWKTADVSAWFAQTVNQVVQNGNLPGTCASAPGYERFGELVKARNFPTSVHRHIMVLGAPAQRLLSFLPDSTVGGNSLACDPVPPATKVSEYDDAFFQGAEDAFVGATSRRQQQRLLEQMIPDAAARQQLQAFFEDHPALRQQFPGGLVQFAQVAANMPDEMLEEILMGHALNEEGVMQQQGGMPGGMPGDDMVFLEFPEGDEDHEGENIVYEGENVDIERDHQHDEGEDDEEVDDDEDEEEAIPLPTRVLRNLMSRLFGASAADDADDSSEDEETGHPPRDDAGVD